MALDERMTPAAIDLLKSRGLIAISDSQVGWDARVAGKKEEWKFLARVYPEIYLELFQCADPLGCTECRVSGNSRILLGWMHRQSYCEADVIRWFWGHETIIQMAWTSRKDIGSWAWNRHFRNDGRGKISKAIWNYDGRHRTLGVAIPFRDLPQGLVTIERYERPLIKQAKEPQRD